MAVAGLCGMVPGAALAVLAVTLPSSLVFNDMVGNAGFVRATGDAAGGVETNYHYLPLLSPAIYLPAYLLGLLAAAAGAVAAVSGLLRLVGDPARRRTVRTLCWSLPLVAAAGCLAGVGAASASGFAYGSRTVAQTLLAVVLTATVALILIRAAATSPALRRPRSGSSTGGP